MGRLVCDNDLDTECITSYPMHGTKCKQLLTVTKDTF